MKLPLTAVTSAFFITLMAFASPAAEGPWVAYEGKEGPGRGKHVVFLTGDEEYRSEEGLPQLAKILAVRHGFSCTVLFAIDAATGEINPNEKTNLPGIETLARADMAVMLWRFREPSDEAMGHFVDFCQAGKPLVALRTSTHAFAFEKNKQSPHAKWDWRSKEWPGGFGKQVLGETWVTHWGKHKVEATRGLIEPTAKEHPIVRGVSDIFGDTDVYEAAPPPDAQVLVRGVVLQGMKPDDAPADYVKKLAGGKGEQAVNDPAMPVVWTREHRWADGKPQKIVTTTMGSATDLQNEGFRRLLVNAVYWGTGLEVPAKAAVALVGDFSASPYAHNGFKKGVKPQDHALPAQ